jgi:hypothetical protein
MRARGGGAHAERMLRMTREARRHFDFVPWNDITELARASHPVPPSPLPLSSCNRAPPPNDLSHGRGAPLSAHARCAQSTLVLVDDVPSIGDVARAAAAARAAGLLEEVACWNEVARPLLPAVELLLPAAASVPVRGLLRDSAVTRGFRV